MVVVLDDLWPVIQLFAFQQNFYKTPCRYPDGTNWRWTMDRRIVLFMSVMWLFCSLPTWANSSDSSELYPCRTRWFPCNLWSVFYIRMQIMIGIGEFQNIIREQVLQKRGTLRHLIVTYSGKRLFAQCSFQVWNSALCPYFQTFGIICILLLTKF